jgi:simple sugar transport system permease protein
MSSRAARFAPWAALLVLLAANAAFTPGFLEVGVRDGRLSGALVDLLHRAVPVALLALGSTCAIATGGVDLSVGAVMACASSLSVAALRAGAGLPAAVALPLLAGILLGAWNGALVAFARVPPILATLVLLVAGRGLAQILTGGGVAHAPDPAWRELGRATLLGIPADLVLLAGVGALVALLAVRTTFGLHVAAIGVNARAARLAGLPVALVLLVAYALSGACAGLAGVLVGADLGAADASQIGLYAELDAILAVALGGTPLGGGRPNLQGSLGGALASQALTTTLLLQGAGTSAQLAAKAVLVLAVAALGARRAESSREGQALA